MLKSLSAIMSRRADSELWKGGSACEIQLCHVREHRPPAPDGPGELRCRQSIQHVVLRKPGAPQLQYAVANLFHVRRVMRVSIHNKLHAFGLRHAQVLIAQIKAFRITIVFHGYACLDGRGEHLVIVKTKACAVQEPAPGRMSD